MEPDGSIRTVYYDVLGNGGFRAIVKTQMPGSYQHQTIFHTKFAQPMFPIEVKRPVYKFNT